MGDAPAVEEGVTGREATQLLKIAKALKAAEAAEKGVKERLLSKLRLRPQGRDQLLRQAVTAENAGDLAGAAEFLEEAGELLAAGRLYERAAASLG